MPKTAGSAGGRLEAKQEITCQRRAAVTDWFDSTVADMLVALLKTFATMSMISKDCKLLAMAAVSRKVVSEQSILAVTPTTKKAARIRAGFMTKGGRNRLCNQSEITITLVLN